MIFYSHKLEGTLSKYLESIFHFKDFMPDHSIERVVPTGHIFIIFELDDFVRNTFDNQTLSPKQSFTKVWVSGIHKNYISISAHLKSEMFVIQFKAFGGYPFFHFPMEDLNERIVPAEEIFGKEILELRENILNAKSSEDKFDHAETWLNKRFLREKVPSSEFLSVLEKLQTEPVTNYNQIIQSYPKTKKHLIAQFKKYVGLTPKYYQRILRFNEILQQIQKSDKIKWSQIAYQCGYTDQSHFIKEFKHFSGFNPKKYIQQDFHKGETNFFPLDRKGYSFTISVSVILEYFGFFNLKSTKMTTDQVNIPKWFWVVTIILMIWNLMGVMSFFQHITISEEALLALPQNEQELYGKYPLWAKVAFAVAVFGGLAGSIALALKKKIAKPIFIISLIGIVVQMGHSLFIAGAMDVYGPGAAVMPVMVILIAALAIWFAGNCITKKWIK